MLSGLRSAWLRSLSRKPPQATSSSLRRMTANRLRRSSCLASIEWQKSFRPEGFFLYAESSLCSVRAAVTFDAAQAPIPRRLAFLLVLGWLEFRYGVGGAVHTSASIYIRDLPMIQERPVHFAKRIDVSRLPRIFPSSHLSRGLFVQRLWNGLTKCRMPGGLTLVHSQHYCLRHR